MCGRGGVVPGLRDAVGRYRVEWFAVGPVAIPTRVAYSGAAPRLEILQTAPDARLHFKRMLNERYGTIDYPTMFWALEHSPEPREGMQAFMEKRQPDWIPDDV